MQRKGCWLSELSLDPLFELQRALDVGVERRFRKDIDEVNLFAKNVIIKRLEEIAQAHNEGKDFEREDLLSKFMAHAHGAEDSYSDKELRDGTIDFLLAGRDTTTATLAWFIYEICCNPEIADKIYKGSKWSVNTLLLSPWRSILTHDNLGRVHYLHAALSESLRLHPPVPRDGKTAFADDILPDGKHVKKGEIVQYVPYCMGRMPFLWGSDALKIKPERWLRDGVFHNESPFKFTVFQLLDIHKF